MGEKWIGKCVSIHCGSTLGVFQGTIKQTDQTKITITRAFRNGLPIKKQDAEVTIMASDIIKLDIIPTAQAQTNFIPVAVNNPTPVKEPNFQAVRQSALSTKMRDMKLNPSKSPHVNQQIQSQKPAKPKSPAGNGKSGMNNNYFPVAQEARRDSSKPIDIAPNGNKLNGSISFNKADKKKAKRNNNNIQTFGTPVDNPVMDGDFDFEKNLALFDKQAIWDEIELERQSSSRTKNNGKVNPNQKYKHDENILVGSPTVYRQIETERPSQQEYTTDDGLIIPSIPILLRTRVQNLAEMNGLIWERQCDMLARGTSEIAMQLIGGARRLIPKNHHQWPNIVIVCDEPFNERMSEVGIATGRQLATHGLKIMVLVKTTPRIDRASKELELYAATGNRFTTSIGDLPSPDLVILAMCSGNVVGPLRKWLTDNRSPVLAIDPPKGGISGAQVKCSVLPVLPIEDLGPNCGKLYLANLCIPDKFFAESGIRYKSPFGHKFVIPIHNMVT